MTLETTRAAGFFRLPGRVTPRITLRSSGVRQVERSDHHASTKASFRLRHVEIEAEPSPAQPPGEVATRETTQRVTVRV